MSVMLDKLEIRITAKGVETQEQSEFCDTLAVDMQQGYYHFKPMSISSLSTILNTADVVGGN